MWPFQGATRQAMAQTHTAVAELVVLHNGKPVYQLVIVGGSVTTEANRSVARSLGATITDPTGVLSGGDIADLLSPYNCEVIPYRGVVVGTKTEWAPLGVYRLTQRHPKGDGTVDLTGQDRAMIYQGPMSGTLSISANTPVETAIYSLLRTRYSGLKVIPRSTGQVVGPLLYQPDIDVWAESQKLAQGVGCWLYHDRVGELVFGSAIPTTANPVARYAEGDGVLQTVSRTEDADKIHNVVVVQSPANSTGVVVSATAEDTDPTSPTYSYGSYGRHVLVVTNQSITTTIQAQQAATSLLVQELGRSETVSFTIVPDPTLDVLDPVIVHRPIVGLVNHAVIIDRTTLPLAVTEVMQVDCRKYIQLRDGQSIQTQLAQLA